MAVRRATFDFRFTTRVRRPVVARPRARRSDPRRIRGSEKSRGKFRRIRLFSRHIESPRAKRSREEFTFHLTDAFPVCAYIRARARARTLRYATFVMRCARLLGSHLPSFLGQSGAASRRLRALAALDWRRTGVRADATRWRARCMTGEARSGGRDEEASLVHKMAVYLTGP